MVLSGCGHLPHADGADEPAGRPPDGRVVADFDGDGTDDTLAVYRAGDGRRGVLGLDTPDGLVASPIYPLWSATAAHLDGTGRASIILGVWSSVERGGVSGLRRAVWVVEWDGESFRPVWRGSALARPLLDLRVSDLDDDAVDELLALEAGPAGCALTAYEWTGFGFNGAGSARVACEQIAFCDRFGPSVTLCSEEWPNRAVPRLDATGLRLEVSDDGA